MAAASENAGLSQDELDENYERQKEELTALEAIYADDFTLQDTSPGKVEGTIQARVELDGDTSIIVHGFTGDASSETLKPVSEDEDSPTVTVDVRFLPPIALHFTHPLTYPSHSPPTFELECRWITAEQRQILTDALSRIWEEERDVCLYSFVEYLIRDGLHASGVFRPGHDAIHISCPSGSLRPSELADWIVDQDHKRSQWEFEQSSFDCGVCLSTKPGKDCFRFTRGCKHVFCRECLLDYFSMLIKEGTALLVGCPQPACVKKRKQADEPHRIEGGGDAPDPSVTSPTSLPTPPPPNPTYPTPQVSLPDLQSLLPPTLYTRYTTLLESHTLSLRRDVTNCPRPTCQHPVIRDPHSEKLCICTQCRFAFCFYCNRCWHGAAQFCMPNHIEVLVSQYTLALESNNTNKIRELEVRYGRKTLERLTREWLAEAETRRWKEEFTQSCPNCSLAVEKSEGCNHMTCNICRTHFCYVCGVKLNAFNPYAHFNDPASRCFRALFDRAEGGAGLGEWEQDAGEEEGEWFPEEVVVRMALEEMGA
ncbi:uncharacterized protein EV422DRAFT_618516 [Fimicolochytrium jonesii]|uniref:uncharacterized protein n=1 Tax=Fimicolochytrium jonesii TaxID=1396493 RepID=UPI0022FE843C|nr:uncharacterized protein EV422DRAFT_618516 [Fimicolochytrium jonesii]KAI8823707.1 hypothetical protein EV422DRAFT_618516 [Fimicolochytrium jonesii]